MKTVNELIHEFSKSNLKVIGEYENIDSKTKVKAQDELGYFYYLSIAMVRNNIRLKRGYDKFSTKNPFTIENIKTNIEENNLNITLLSVEYIGNKSNLLWKCACGKSFNRSLGNVTGLKRVMCEDCANTKSRQTAINKRHSYSEVKLKFKENGYLLLEDEYINANTKMKCVDDDGFLYETTYDMLVNSKVTPYKFHSTNKYSIHNISQYISKNNIDCEIISNEYIDYCTPLLFKCSCGKTFKTNLSHFLYDNKFRCNVCSKNQSLISLKTETWLNENEIAHKKEVSFSDLKSKNNKPLRYDFYLKDLNILIEVDGKQHYEKAWGITDDKFIENMNRDKAKDEYAVNNKIKLVRIPYYEYDNDNYVKILEENILNTISN